MRRISLALSAFAVSSSLFLFSGCGDDQKVADIKESEAAKNANAAGIKAIEEATKGKSVTKNPEKQGGTSGVAAPK